MRMRKLLAVVLAVLVMSTLFVFPGISASAANTVTIGLAEGGNGALSTSAVGAKAQPRNGVFTVSGTSSANAIEVTILSSVNGSVLTDEIAYINQDTSNSSTGAFSFTFMVRDSVPDGTYVVAVGGEGVTMADANKRYFELVTELPPFITVDAIKPVQEGTKFVFTGTTNLGGLNAELLDRFNNPLAGRTCVCVVAAGSGTTSTYSGEISVVGLAAGTYKIRVTDANGTTNIISANTSIYSGTPKPGDCGGSNDTPDGAINMQDTRVLVVRLAEGLNAPNLLGVARTNADVHKNGNINMQDLNKLTRWLAEPDNNKTIDLTNNSL